MFIALLITAAVVAVTGLALRYIVPWILKDSDWSISWREYFAGLIAAYCVVMPAVFIASKALSTADALRYEEFRNGVETSATVNVVDCFPGTSGPSAASGYSNCNNQYPSGETYTYLETVVHTTQNCDGDGDCTTETYTTVETRIGFIYNPYANKEYTYAITDSLGGGYAFPYAYVKDGEGFQGLAIPKELPRGDPAEWTDAKTRLDAGNPRPVTRLFDYNNYVLASHDDLLVPFSKNVERYLSEGILPDHTKDITTNPLYGFNNSTADKVSFVGVTVSDPEAWQAALMNFDAALGSKLQGDLHLVLIDASLVDNPTDYLNALKAYWLGDDFGRRAIAKNAIIVVAAVDGDTIKWGMASTGMPFGNEVMLRGIQDFLPDTPLNPADVIGYPRTVVTPSTDGGDDDVRVTLGESPGVLERIVLRDFPFQRACMDCKDDGTQIGYANLVIDIEPKPWQFAIMISIVGVLALVWWFIAGKYEFFNWLPGSSSRRKDDDEYRDTSYDPYLIDESRPRFKKLKKWRRDLGDRFDRFRY